MTKHISTVYELHYELEEEPFIKNFKLLSSARAYQKEQIAGVKVSPSARKYIAKAFRDSYIVEVVTKKQRIND